VGDRKKGRILVVDDEEVIRITVSMLLKNEGYDVMVAAGGEEALARIREQEFDLVLTDVRMDGMSGIDLIKEIKKLPVDMESIIMTSYTSLEIAVLALRSGAYDFLIKPFDKLDLVSAAVSRAVERTNHVREIKVLTETVARKDKELAELNRVLAGSGNPKS